MGDKYIEKLDEIKERKEQYLAELRHYFKSKKRTCSHFFSPELLGSLLEENLYNPKIRGSMNADAMIRLNEGAGKGFPGKALEGAKIYDILGKGNSSSIKRRLRESIELRKSINLLKKQKYQDHEECYGEIETWLNEHPESKETKSLDNLTK